MSYILTILLFVFSVFSAVKIYKKDRDMDDIKKFVLFMCFSIVAIIFATIGIYQTQRIITTYVEIDADVEAWRQNYDLIVYQLENKMYTENNVGLRDLIDRVEYWNYDLARRKELADNFWVGIYYPDVYDDFEFIDLADYDLT